MHAHTRTRTHTHKHSHTHSHTHTRTHTHTHCGVLRCPRCLGAGRAAAAVGEGMTMMTGTATVDGAVVGTGTEVYYIFINVYMYIQSYLSIHMCILSYLAMFWSLLPL